MHSLVVKIIWTVIVTVLLASCAGNPPMRTAEQDLKAVPDAALIVFLRPNQLAFGGAEISLWDRGKFIGLIEPVTFISYRVKPGEHVFMVKAENWDIVKGKVSAGKTYYFWIDPRAGLVGTRVSMTVLDPDDKRIKDWMSRCRPITLQNLGQAAVYEKKYKLHVAKAISNLDSGKAYYKKISPSQGK